MGKNKYIRLLAMSLVIIIALSFIQDFADFLDENSATNPQTAYAECNPQRKWGFNRISNDTDSNWFRL